MIESILSGVIANSAYTAAKKYFRTMTGIDDDEMVQELYQCFETSLHKYCNQSDSYEHCKNNLFMHREKNWEVIVNILNFSNKSVDIDVSKLDLSSTSNYFKYTKEDAKNYVEILQKEIYRNKNLTNYLTKNKAIFDACADIKEIKIYIDTIKNTNSKVDFPEYIRTSNNSIEAQLDSMFAGERYIDWLGKDLYFETRKLLLEIIDNAYKHGNATECSVFIDHDQIKIIDNGREFNPHRQFINFSYKNISDGIGKHYYQEYCHKYDDDIVKMGYYYDDSKNHFRVKFLQPNNSIYNDCAVFKHPDYHYIEYPEDCDIYYYEVDMYLMVSKSYEYISDIVKKLPEGKKLHVRVYTEIEYNTFQSKFLGHPDVRIELA